MAWPLGRAISIAAGLLLTLGSGVDTEAQRAVRSDKACSLLTAADLKAVVGASPEKPLAGLEVPYTKDADHDHTGSTFTCQGKVGGRFVSVIFGPQQVTAEGRKRSEAKIRASQEKLLKKGYGINTKELGGVKCWTMAAPPGDTSEMALFGTSCGGTKGAYFYSITISAAGKGDLIPIETLKALADKAASRLP